MVVLSLVGLPGFGGEYQRTLFTSPDHFVAPDAQPPGFPHRVRLRYLPGLTQDMRLVWRNRTLEIVSLLEHGNRSEHEAICEEQR